MTRGTGGGGPGRARARAAGATTTVGEVDSNFNKRKAISICGVSGGAPSFRFVLTGAPDYTTQ